MQFLHVSYFSTTFDRWLRTHDKLLVEISKECRIPGANLSRLRSGKQPANADLLTKLLPVIEKHSSSSDAVELLLDYLRDETPEAYRSAVYLQPRHHTLSETPGKYAKRALNPLSEMFERWIDKAQRDQEFAGMLLTMDAYMHFSADEAAVRIAAIPVKTNDLQESRYSADKLL